MIERGNNHGLVDREFVGTENEFLISTSRHSSVRVASKWRSDNSTKSQNLFSGRKLKYEYLDNSSFNPLDPCCVRFAKMKTNLDW